MLLTSLFISLKNSIFVSIGLHELANQNDTNVEYGKPCNRPIIKVLLAY